MNKGKGVVTRFPPSPTGFLHIGGVRTALFNYLFAAHQGGTMRFRFEDTDRVRSKPEFEEEILEGLRWVSIPFTIPLVPRQSERTEVYKTHLSRLIQEGKAYEAEEAETGGGKVVRFRNPNTSITFTDLIRGPLTFDTTELEDFVIARNLNNPLYHLAVVVDDEESGVTHVIRGEDHISNTPRQILLLEALGFTRPEYAHMPLILAPDRSKLSKRHGAVSVNEYRRMGYLPEALINYLALLGWNPGDDREIFTLPELVEFFSLDKVQKSGAIFNLEKLTWLNREHLRRLSDGEFTNRLEEYASSQGVVVSLDQKVLPLLRERAHTLKEALEMLQGELIFVSARPTPIATMLVGLPAQAGKKETPEVTKRHLTHVRDLLHEVGDWNSATVKAATFPYAEKEGKGSVLWPFRVSLSGQERSPDPFTIAEILGKEETLARIEAAIAAL